MLAPSRLIRARGEVAVWELGEGEPVLLMHGFPDHAVGLLGAAERLARAGFRAVTVAYPGYWPSTPVPGGDYSMAANATDIIAVLDALELPRAHVFGHGWARCTAIGSRVDIPSGSVGSSGSPPRIRSGFAFAGASSPSSRRPSTR